MKYTLMADLEVDTKLGKVIIITHAEGKRIVIMPVTRGGEDVYCIVDDKPGPQIKTASSLARYIAQNLYSKKEIRDLAGAHD